jgi:hypothetical protein
MPETRGWSRFSPVLVLPVLLCTACATAPSSAPQRAAAPDATPRVSLICHGKARAASFEKLGVPPEERPIAVAMGGGAVYVLFAPARLLRVTEEGGKLQTEMALGRSGETWTALDVDPVDGSAWLAGDNLSLVQVSPAWKLRSVKLQKVEGPGAFERLLVAPDAIYAMPSCAETSVWRISRDGAVLGTSFPAVPPDPAQPVQPSELRCSTVRLERDGGGQILAWDARRNTLQQADAQGAWTAGTAADTTFFAAAQRSTAEHVARGVAVGERDEQWYVKTGPRDLFWWKGRPVFLGPITTKNTGGQETLLLVPQGNEVREVIESCYGATIAGIATTPTRYAAFTSGALILGDFATAPDLP